LGQPNALLESSVQAGNGALSEKQQTQLASIDKMVGTLEAKLKTDPNNHQGWIMLGRTYMVLKRYPDAVSAYESADKLQPNNPATLLSMADAIAASDQGQLVGKAETLIKQALQVDGNHMMGLWLAGLAAKQRGANKEALTHWQKLEAMLAPDSEDRQKIAALISSVGGTPAVAAAPVANVAPPTPAVTNTAAPLAAPVVTQTAVPADAIVVTVRLSEALKAQAKPSDLVFIYAKALSGPPMPLAAVRKQVKDLPLEITLDDSMAMMPQMRLSAFVDVKVGARVSLTGTPQAQVGDLFAEKSPVKKGDRIIIEINQVVAQ
jgi:cytochrome c-type biogenesis protein CcmH